MRYAGSALMLFVTMAAAIGSYTVNLRVSSERTEVDRLRHRLVADARDIRNLQAELRTRARLPEMQRWNDSVLQMSAPAATQYLQSPVQLASFGAAPAPPAAAQPDVRYAVATPAPAAPITAPVQRAAYRPAPAPASVTAPDAARILKASYAAAPRSPAPVPVADPIDLAAEIDAALPTATSAEEQ
jgi:hypothetical protein